MSNGLFTTLFHQNALNAAAEGNVNGDDAEAARERVRRGRAWNIKEGKEPMSTTLFDAVCGWKLQIGMKDMIFAHCYLLMTWHLCARSNTTANILIGDVAWSTLFDSFHVMVGVSLCYQFYMLILRSHLLFLVI
jgi:hypothetical protein